MKSSLQIFIYIAIFILPYVSCKQQQLLVITGGLEVNSTIVVFQFDRNLTLVSKSAAAGISPAFIAWHPRQNNINSILVATRSNSKLQINGTLTGLWWVNDLINGTRTPNVTDTEVTSIDVDDPVHLSIHPSGKWAVSASFGAGTITVTELGYGAAAIGTILPTTKAGIKAHQIKFDPIDASKFYTPCLGSDWVRMYNIDAKTGSITPNIDPATGVNTVPFPQNSGPRHMAFHPTLPIAYVITEVGNTIARLNWDKNSTGILSGDLLTPNSSRIVSTLPIDLQCTPQPDRNITCPLQRAANILVSKDGMFLYASNRGGKGAVSSIAIFSIDSTSDGSLTPVTWETADGDINYPREMTLTPDEKYLLVANENGNSLTVLSRDASSGLLTKIQTVDTRQYSLRPSFISVIPAPF